MSKILIEAYPKFVKPIPAEPYLKVSEFYMDTIQGEGIYTGYPAAFLRLQGCHVGCSFCDTKEVWREGNPYTFDELFKIIEESGLVEKLHKKNHHLVITGGSPLLQQDTLKQFFYEWLQRYDTFPFVEIENEATIIPSPDFVYYISCWNNSPKLALSGVSFKNRYKILAIGTVSELPDSWFKFVVSNDNDWEEIEVGFLQPQLIKKHQIILMPKGATRLEIQQNQQIVVNMAIENGVRYTTREHIVLWDKKVGV